MIGTSETREIVDWRKTTEDGETVYEIEYSEPVPEPTGRSKTLFGASSGGTVPAGEQYFELPDGERIPASEAVFDAEGTTLRVRRRSSLAARLRRYLPW
ncbi:hypothetical protein [Natrinema salsiterrestre]|uniref:Uncharacterized protein n=1 Tax=Natrinema salsiterrestre TaxID=2950540 RepID=A0A9Q4PZM3_9EURY|nr:hypothetical protein [Natrinema salsiterrestre]MDF9745095.1 hypothetical protein [Natrinema salsiterrestre]